MISLDASYEKNSKIFDEIERKPEFSAYDLKEVWVPMSDGKRLLCHISFPHGEYKSLPVILLRTPYGPKSLRFFHEMSFYGYICVCQFVRGTYKSEGEWAPSKNERADGLDTVKWIINQPWCNQKITMTGASYLSMCQWILADVLPPQVKTLDLEVYNPYRYPQLYTNGMFRLEAYTGWTAYNYGNASPVYPINELYERALNFRPQISMDLALFNIKLPWYRDWILSPKGSEALWSSGVWGILKNMPQKVKVPVCMRCAWYDPHLNGMLKAWRLLPKEIRSKSLLIISPFNHKGTASSDLPIPDGYKYIGQRYIKSKLKWYDAYLKGLPLKGLPESGIFAYVFGDNSWQVFPSLDMEAQVHKLYFNLKDSALCAEPIQGEYPAEYIYDPDNPVKTCGSEVIMTDYMYHGYRQSAQGIRLLPPPSEREDVISLISDSFNENILITNSIEVELTVSSSAPDTSFCVKLSQTGPDGRFYHIRDTITTLSFGRTEDNPYIPNSKVILTLKLWQIFIKIKKGSRLRLDITSSNFPAYSIHPNTKNTWSAETRYEKAKQTIYSGKILF